ncbi:MAG: geopeptide radical SAM maturase [Thermodesulfobacteriota bacterium]|jgi:uncharacterized protein
MVLSPYAKAFPHPDKPGTVVVFSARKASVCLIPEALFNRLERGDVPESARAALTRLGVLVGDPEAERVEVAGYLDRVNDLSTGLGVAVILGLECNFRCTYCYEGTLKGPSSMTGATADQLVEFLQGRFREGMNELILDFYGGEPLLYTERIRQISTALGPFAAGRGAKYSFTLVTNGSLLTPAMVEGLLPLGLRAAKVTLDGPAENHDRFRPFRSGRGSFDDIFKNLLACCDLFPVGIGGTYTRENYRAFPALLDYMMEQGLSPGRVAQVSFGPVMQTSGEHAPEHCSGCATVNEPWLAEASVFLREEVLRRGYRVPRIAPTPCMVDRTDAFTVHYDGTLTKCPGLIGDEKRAVGDVWTGFRDYREDFSLDRLTDAAECERCEYLPLCFGGCRFMRLQREGHMKGVECQRSFLDATLRPHLLQDIRYRLATGG